MHKESTMRSRCQSMVWTSGTCRTTASKGGVKMITTLTMVRIMQRKIPHVGASPGRPQPPPGQWR
jgi:hypothetical protein